MKELLYLFIYQLKIILMKNKNLIVLSSPSGGGKSTIARYILKNYPNIRFSISATTRNKRPLEKHGKEYFFLKKEEFTNLIEKNQLVEYEEIFGNYYGTLCSEIDSAIKSSKKLLFDVDVKGAISIKNAYPEESLLIFISPPSIQELENRLRKRSTETDEQIQTRLARAQMEMNNTNSFDFIIINEILNDTFIKIDAILKDII
jgi:guanylate kinase